MKSIAIIPTYNERTNIQDIISVIREFIPREDMDILVVDSASPDGTADAIREIQKQDPTVFLFLQTGKLGLGRAYLDGMHWALSRPYANIITMDADFSHHPRYLRAMLDSNREFDLTIGSRYVEGGTLVSWPLRRRLLSKFANWYARTLTGLPFSDLTAGFHCFRASLLRDILKNPIRTEGYAFLVELKFLSIREGAQFQEVPIVFKDRTQGESKISHKVMWESMRFVLRLMRHRWEIKHRLKQLKSARTVPSRSIGIGSEQSSQLQESEKHTLK